MTPTSIVRWKQCIVFPNYTLFRLCLFRSKSHPQLFVNETFLQVPAGYDISMDEVNKGTLGNNHSVGEVWEVPWGHMISEQMVKGSFPD